MPGEPVVLDSFGGIVATARPEDIPEGASPRCNDVDFVVGRFIQRPGCQSVYSLTPSQYGPNGGSSAVDINTAGSPWTNPTNILLQDGVFTTINLTAHNGVGSVTVVPGTPISGSVIVNATTTSAGGMAATDVNTYSATSTDTSCNLEITGFYPPLRIFEQAEAHASWGGFVFPTLPAGAVVTAIIPVCDYMGVDLGTTGAAYFPVGWGSVDPPFPGTGHFEGASIGTTPAAVTAFNPSVQIEVTLRLTNYNSQLNITNLGLKVEYTVPAAGQGGYYALTETPIIGFSATTGSGATATANTTTVGSGPGAYKYVSSVTVTAPGNYTGTIIATFTGAADPANNAVGVVTMIPIGQLSDNILVTGFGFAVPASYLVNGIEVGIKGFSSNAILNVQMVKGGSLIGTPKSFPLPTSNAFVNFGSPTDLWGTTWLNTDVDASNFGLEVWVTSPAAVAVSLDYADITVFGIPAPANFLGICNADLDETDQVTLVLDSNGLTWEEDVTNNPNVLKLQTLIPSVVPGSYLKGLDAGGTAYMAYSDLTQGTSQPMQFNGAWADRITQVGPGSAPQFTPQQSTSNTFNITQISQPPQATDPFSNPFYGGIYFLQSSGPGSTAPGNVITIYYGDSSTPGASNADLIAAMATGFPVYIYMSVTGTPATFGPETVQVTAVGEASPPGQPRQFFYFSFVTTSSAFTYYQGSGHPSYHVAWNRTLAILQTASPVPGLTVGNRVTIAGSSVANWDATWVITETLDSGAMAITDTQVTGGVATYNYSVTSGANPAAGELITVTNTTNANGALNVVNATIVSVSGGSTGTLTVNVPVATDYGSVPESGQATTAGTLFTFDPGSLVVNTSTSPIYGTGTGGTLTFTGAAGIFITAGTKQGSVFFITRNGAVTRPAPPQTFTVPANCGAILCTHVPVGPPDVVARGITFTESGQNGVAGANFYYYDTPVSFFVSGVEYTSQALIIPDNTSTTASLAFSDSVLLASDEIDIPGNDYFNLMELGSPAWLFQYANRMMYGLCQTKIQNLLNMSFDGGYQPTYSVTALPMPAGWSNTTGNLATFSVTAFSITSNIVTFTAANSLLPGWTVIVTGLTTGTYLNGQTLQVLTATGTQFTAAFTHANVTLTSDAGTGIVTNSSIGLVLSADFGNAFDMINYGSSPWTNANVLFQPAYQDYLNVNIIQPNTAYSVRVKARSLNADGQTVTIQLPTYAAGAFGPTIYGSASFVFNQGTYTIQTGTLITGNGLPLVPSNLQIALGVSNIAIGAGIEVDRIEVFPTNHPVDTTTIWTSYAGKFESIDIVTGSLGVGAENPQPATGAFEILEQLYIEKTKSLQVTQDSPNYEPNNWQVRQASDRAGAVGPNAFDEGEEFAISANRNGVYFFDGGKPMPILRELQSTASGLNMWEYVNWAFGGKTVWIRNDLNNRRLMIGIPMNTPNPWLPNAAVVQPASPNVILMCNYTGCPTGEELAQSSEVHVTMFGDLKALDMRRKWSLWQIPCPIAEFVPRQDTFTAPLFLCNGIDSTKIYQLVNGAAVGGQNTDDGAAINWSYTTYGFVKAKQGQQQPGLGALRKVWYYMAATMEGVGQVAGKLYSNSLGALTRNTFTVPLPFTLSSPQQNDQERVLEIGGQRVFVEFSSIGTGGYAEVGPVMLDGEMDKVSPHRGVSS